MSIKVIKYSDPYNIDKTTFWKNSALRLHLCASEGIKNGLKNKYDTSDRVVLTIDEIVRSVYKKWYSDSTKYIDQYISISNDSKKQAYKFNRENILNALRLLKELEIDPEELKKVLKGEDKNSDLMELEIYEVYKGFYENESINGEKSNESNKNYEVKAYIEKGILEAINNSTDEESVKMNYDDLVPIEEIYIHGLHQFTSIIIKLLNDICEGGYNIIFANNYLNEYKSIYDTWDKVYLNIGSYEGENTEVKKYIPWGNQYYKLAGLLESIENENVSAEYMDKAEVISFANIFEYKEYIEDSKETHFVVTKEVSNILESEKGKKKNLIGHALGIVIASIYNMIDYNDSGKRSIRYDKVTLNQIAFYYEKLNEESKGIYNILVKLEFYIRDCKTINDVAIAIENLISKKQTIYLKDFEGFDFWNNSVQQLLGLKKFIEYILNICKRLFDENSKKINLVDHYKELRKILEELEYVGLIVNGKEIMEQIEAMKYRTMESINIEFEYCDFQELKYSIGYYLNPNINLNEENINNVKGIENIEGGIWNLKGPIHLGCLSNEGINKSRSKSVPWPLNIELLKRLKSGEKKIFNKDIYIKSIEEYSNFIRYSMFYGLIFYKDDIKLSYIKEIGVNKYTLYYLFKMINMETEYVPSFEKIDKQIETINNDRYKGNIQSDRIDSATFKFCKHRYLLEKVLDESENAIFEGEYNTIRYCSQLIKNLTLEWCSKEVRKKDDVEKYINNLSSRLIAVVPSLKKILDLYDIRRETFEYITSRKDYIVPRGIKVPYHNSDLTRNFLRLKVNGKELYGNKDMSNNIRTYLNNSNNNKEQDMCGDCPKQYICLERYYK